MAACGLAIFAQFQRDRAELESRHAKTARDEAQNQRSRVNSKADGRKLPATRPGSGSNWRWKP